MVVGQLGKPFGLSEGPSKIQIWSPCRWWSPLCPGSEAKAFDCKMGQGPGLSTLSLRGLKYTIEFTLMYHKQSRGHLGHAI